MTRQQSGHKKRAWLYVVIAGVLVSIGLFSLGRYTAAPAQHAVVDTSVKSIAVLPFATLSDDRNDAYFADGVQDQILTNLAKVSDLKVISHTSVRQYKTGADATCAKSGGSLVSLTLWKARSNVRVIAFASMPN